MAKFAKTKSSDPNQQRLRDHKDQWNLAAKEFISRVIAFKKALNGRGDSHYSLAPNNIKDPFPSNVGSFLNEIAGNFEQLASEAFKIQEEQANYSKNRRQPQPVGITPTKTANSKTSQLRIGKHIVPTLLAVSAEEQERGLMGKEWPPPVMSFVYNSPTINKFWMKNTPSPLDIVFALNGRIIDIHKGEPNSTTLVGGQRFSDLVVELPFGTCTKLGIKIGDEVGIANSLNFLENL